MSEISKTSFPEVSRIRKSSRTWGSPAIKPYYRDVEISELRRIINPADEPLIMYYVGSGSDIRVPLEFTGATRLIFADLADQKKALMANLADTKKVEELSDWEKINDVKHRLTFMYEGKKRELIFLKGDATKTVPIEVRMGYDVLLTCFTETLLFSRIVNYDWIFRGLREGGFYLAGTDCGEPLHGMASEYFGFIPKAATGKKARELEFYLLNKSATHQLSSSIMAEWKLRRILDQHKIMDDILKHLAEAGEARNNPAQLAEYFTAGINLFAACGELSKIKKALGDLETREKQREYAKRLINGTEKFDHLFTSGELQGSIKKIFSAEVEATADAKKDKILKMLSGYTEAAIREINYCYARFKELAS